MYMDVCARKMKNICKAKIYDNPPVSGASFQVRIYPTTGEDEKNRDDAVNTPRLILYACTCIYTLDVLCA